MPLWDKCYPSCHQLQQLIWFLSSSSTTISIEVDLNLGDNLKHNLVFNFFIIIIIIIIIIIVIIIINY